ncbi:VOC family protein [Methylobacter luteus]|uniref:VOC family protein n=1 Tax=Methylobacter luteus TaxID=415 RepID=UPI00040BF82E|nr:VOC family protein [Methylobacter luteus]
MTVRPIPDGYHNITPYLCIKGATEAIEFYKRAFDAAEVFRLVTPGGEIGHAEIRIGDSSLMLSDACDQSPLRNPQSQGGSSIGLYLYVADVDAQFAKAVGAGAKVISPLLDQFYGDRTGTLEDPFGHIWYLASHIEDLSHEEISRRAETLFSAQCG